VLVACIATSLVFYCLVLVAVAMVLPRAELLSYPLPVAQAFRVAFHSVLISNFILAGGLLGLIAVWNALFFAATRVLFALGRARLLHPSLGRLGAGAKAPTRAIVFVTAICIAGLFLGKGILLPVVNITSTLFALMYAIVAIGVLHHRHDQHSAPGAYQVPGGQLLVWAAVLIALYLIVLSLIQQRMDAGGRLPVEWLLLVGLAGAAWALWLVSKAARHSISEAERRGIVLDVITNQ